MANHVSHGSLPYPIKNARFTLLVPYLDADGDPTDPTTPDTELSGDAGAFADCAEEVSTITGSNGMGYITLSGAETNYSLVALCAKVASGPKATLATLSPRNLPILESGTAGAGAAGTLTLASGTYTGLNLTGCFLRTTGGTGGGGTGGANNQARRITSYNTSTRVATVTPNWETTPDNTTTYDVLLPEGVLVPMLTALAPTTLARTLDVSSGGEAGVDWANVGSATTTVNLSGTTVKTATDVETDTADIQTRLPAALTAGGNIKADALAISGDSVAADNAESFFDGTGYAGTNNVIPTVTTATNVTTVNGLAADVITAASIASDAGTEIATAVWASATRTLSALDEDSTTIDIDTTIRSALGFTDNDLDARVTALTSELAKVPKSDGTVTWNATALASIQSEANDALVANNLDHLVLSAVDTDFATTVHANSVIGHLADNGAGFDRTTDSLEAIRDRGDSAWVTATGFSTLDAAGVRSAVGLASANLDTQLADLPTVAEFEARTLVAASYATAANLATVAGYIDTEIGTIITHLTDIKGATFDGSTDSLEALRNRGDAAWVTATSVTVSDKTGFKLASDGLDAVTVETGLNARQALSIIASATGGVLAGAGTTEITIAAAGVPATNRITATVTAAGNRTAVTLAPPA